jgi:DNA-binding response OmpR family regulator
MRVMVVGGDDGRIEELTDRIRMDAVHVAVVADGAAALRNFAVIEPDVVLIRGSLRGELDAFESCRALRSRTDAVLVIVAEDPGPNDEIVALAVGADHLLPVGTSCDLAIARLRTLVRRARGSVILVEDLAPSAVSAVAREPRATAHPKRNGAHVRGSSFDPWLSSGDGEALSTRRITVGDLEIDLLAREVNVLGRLVDVTRTEFDLLVTLARDPRRVMTRAQLMEAAWDVAFDGSHVLDAHLSRLRCKIGQAGGQRVAHAVRGVGYRLHA